jgi:hypothetical protein
MNEDASEVFVILLHTVIKRTYLWLVEKTQDTLLQLPAAFARNNLYQFDALVDCILHDAVEFDFDLVAVVVDVVQVKFEFCHRGFPEKIVWVAMPAVEIRWPYRPITGR